MVEVVASLSARSEPDVHDMVCAGHEADHAGHEEHGALQPVLRLSHGEGTHAQEPHTDQK